jgi:hypothetical protein
MQEWFRFAFLNPTDCSVSSEVSKFVLRPRSRNLIVVGDVSLSLSKGCIGFPQPLLRVYSHHAEIFLSHCPFARPPFNLVRLLLELAKQHCYGFEAFEDRLSV